MIRFRIGTALLGVCMFAPAAWAHHSHAMYDTSKNVALTGTIVSFHWMNPHVWVYLETRDASGTPVQWVLEGGSPATPDDLRKRFETFLSDRCKGKDAGKLRFVVE